ncbi:sulfatase-like hydrolase/transferase [Kaarinaea lacus]
MILFFPLIIEHTYSDFIRGSELNSRVGWFLLLLSIVWIIRKSYVLPLLSVIFIISGGMDILYASTFGGVFTSASLEAAALTDTAEAIDFFKTYASFENLGLLAIYLALCIFLVRNRKQLTPDDRWYKTVVTLGCIMLIVLVYRLGYLGRVFDTIPGFMGTVPGYLKGTKNVAKLVEQRTNLVNTSSISLSNDAEDKSQTYVFIIGESLTRNHMSIYGYHRETTPQLSGYKDELVVFENVISSHTQTQPSLRLALTQATKKNNLDVFDALSIVDIANKAGFKTWWISNQQPLRSTISSIANMADVAHFISNDYHGVTVRRFDGYMLPHIEKAINDEAEKKAIFIHMMGSHLQYDNRVPDDYAVFKDSDVNAYTDDPSYREINYINSYDNSVLYTDWFVAKIIESLKANKNSDLSGLLLFSDHGEEVFDTMDFVGHKPDSISPSMLEIPFITWTSQTYRTERPAIFSAMEQNKSRPFMLDNAYLTMASFMGLQSDDFNVQENLFTDDHATPTRIVYSKNYDKDMKTSGQNLKKHRAVSSIKVKAQDKMKLLK